MNAQSILPTLKDRFEAYVHQFSSDDPIDQENIGLKVAHTLRVCEEIRDIGRSLDLCPEDLCLAEACALLHDIGRFKQYKEYGTFSDYRSEDHAALGVKVIKGNRLLDGLDSGTSEIILKVVGYHNRASLPPGEEERYLFFLKLLRDADKIDIWRVVTDYYQNRGDKRNHIIELDLPDTDQVSESVYNALMNGKLAKMSELKTLNDFKLLQLGWVYDLNFPRTFEIVRERGYLEKIRNALPKESIPVSEIYEQARSYLERPSFNL